MVKIILLALAAGLVVGFSVYKFVLMRDRKAARRARRDRRDAEMRRRMGIDR